MPIGARFFSQRGYSDGRGVLLGMAANGRDRGLHGGLEADVQTVMATPVAPGGEVSGSAMP